MINWDTDSTEDILRKSKAADNQPGVKAQLRLPDGTYVTRLLFGVYREAISSSTSVPPHLSDSVSVGQVFGRRNEAICVRTRDGAIWISQLRTPKKKGESVVSIKLPSIVQLEPDFSHLDLPEFAQDSILPSPNLSTFQEISFERFGSDCGILHFEFYNGAMSTAQCDRLHQALLALKKDTELKVLVLAGGHSSWSNGIHLNVIENSSNPKEEAWANIKAINQVVKDILQLQNMVTISAIQGNAGAGGVYLALAADWVFAKSQVVLNPHYKNMGLYGSELHTFTTPRRVGKAMLEYLKSSAEPLITSEAVSMGLIDDLPQQLAKHSLEYSSTTSPSSFLDNVKAFASKYRANEAKLAVDLARKREEFAESTKYKSIDEYEAQELAEMHDDMFGDRNGFENKRKSFLRK